MNNNCLLTHPTLPPAPPRPRTHGAPWIIHMPVLCTSHLPEGVLNSLSCRDNIDVVAELPDGCILRLPDPEEVDTVTYYFDCPELDTLAKYLTSRGYYYVRLSGELGDIFTDLPVYEW